MKNKYLIITTVIVFIALLVPTMLFAASEEETAKSTVDFIKGKGTFEDWFMYGFNKLDTSLFEYANNVSIIGRVIAGIGALLTLGWMGFSMQSGDKEWEIMPMIKPFLIGLILFNWASFCMMIKKPFEELSKSGEAIYKEISKETDAKRTLLFTKKQKFFDILIDEDVQMQIAAATGENLKDYDFSGLKGGIKKWAMKTKFDLQKVASQGLETIGIIILRVCTYLIFFIQKVWGYILIVLGPLAFGIALIPGFESTITSWIAKFININFYSFIAYVIINIGQQIIIASFDMEIDRYNVMINEASQNNIALAIQYNNAGGMLFSTGMEVVAYLVVGVALLMIPTIADSLVTAGGAMIMSKAKGGAGSIASGAGSIARGAKGGAGSIASGAKGGYQGAKKGMQDKTSLAGKIKGASLGGLKGAYNGARGK